MTDQTAPDEQGAPEPRPFADWLQEQAGGSTHAELTEKLHALIAAVQETGKGGSISLKVDIKPIAGTDGRTLTVTDAVVTKLPRVERPKSIFFITDDGDLSRTDPRQPVITGLRELDQPTSVTHLRSAN
ncbi:hypothetical protein [Streptomyces sp. NPDC090026]|uniref:hypothetical protein n=1 Tax=Streptomyces sp. NPDC090026 TaxID=3365923 RepID=UPI00381F796B